jgi:hypothetical protein
VIRSRTTTGAVLDAAVELVSRRIPGPAGLLVAASLPLRFLEAWLANRLLQLGENASDHVTYLTTVSLLVTLALLPAFWGRAVFARCSALALSAGAEGFARLPLREKLRLPPGAFLSYLYAAALFELLFFAMGWTLVALPLLALFTGLAAATSPLEGRPGVLASLLRVVKSFQPLGVLAGLTLVFLFALPVAFLNLSLVFQILVWAVGGMAGGASAWWSAALGWSNQQFVVLAVAGALLVVEPFWLASLVVTVRQARARQSGEDLETWFAALQGRGEEEVA